MNPHYEPETFSWCRHTQLPMVCPSASSVRCVRFDTIGHDDEMADTMFALYVNDEREIIRRPETMLVRFVDDVAERGAVMVLLGGDKKRHDVDEQEQSRLIAVKERLNDAEWPYQ